jgi:D-amino peptidase
MKALDRIACAVTVAVALTWPVSAYAQTSAPKKVFIDADAEGLEGIFNFNYQSNVIRAIRWNETIKIMTGEVNAAIDGLFAGGATEVVVEDLHSGGQTLSARDIDQRARLMAGGVVDPLEEDSSYSAYVFIGYHPMAGAEKGVLSHGYSLTEIQNIWMNNMLVGELGARTMYAGAKGIPVIMVSGDEAVCEELHRLVPKAECAVVKWGVSRTAGFTLSHPAACSLIRQTARRAMSRMGEIQPYRIEGPVELKLELTTEGVDTWFVQPQDGVKQLDERTWLFQGKNFIEAFLKFQSF